MSIDMYLAEAQSQGTSIQKAGSKQVSGYQKIEQAIQTFTNDTVLESEAYRNGKMFFGTVLLTLLKAGILLAETGGEACANFPEKYVSEVDSISLKSSELEEEIETMSAKIDYMESFKASFQLEKVEKAFEPARERTLANIKRVLSVYETTKQELEKQLEKLTAFHASSPSIFSEIDELHAAIKQGARVANQSWDASSKSFKQPKGADMEWANFITKKYLEKQIDRIEQTLPDISESDWLIIAQFSKMNPNAEMPQSLIDYILVNKDDIIADLKNDALAEFLQALGKGLTKFGDIAPLFDGVTVPIGWNTILVVDGQGLASAATKYGKGLSTVGKAAGYGFMVAGFGIGMWNDTQNNDKTVGEAIVHNGVSTGVGWGAGIGGGAATSVLLGLFGISNPAGWAMLGGLAIGSVAGWIFENNYENNSLGIQDGLDYVGGKIDDGWDWTTDKISDGISWTDGKLGEVGEALVDMGNAINPMNWAW